MLQPFGNSAVAAARLLGSVAVCKFDDNSGQLEPCSADISSFSVQIRRRAEAEAPCAELQTAAASSQPS